MKKYLIVIGFSALFACNPETSKRTSLADSLASVNSGLAKELKEKDTLLTSKEAAMAAFIKSFNEIQQNLDAIKEKEKIIMPGSGTAELKKSDKDQIISDIQTIYDLLGKNRQKAITLGQKLKAANLKADDLETACTNLTNELTKSESEVTDLKTKLADLNIDFSELKIKYTEEKQEADLKTQKLNTGHYIIGSAKDLAKKGLITKEGGFIGIGKVSGLSKSFDENQFTKIDIVQTTEIPLSGKRIKILTVHPGNSYKLVETAGTVSKLVILDPDKFWGASKYLIITAES